MCTLLAEDEGRQRSVKPLAPAEQARVRGWLGHATSLQRRSNERDHQACVSSGTALKHQEEEHMSSFTPDEIAYLQGQRLGRLATVGPDGQPHVVPVSFRYNQPTRRRCRKRPGGSRAAPDDPRS